MKHREAQEGDTLNDLSCSRYHTLKSIAHRNESQNMLTEMVKDWLGRQVWRNANMIEKNSHLGDEFEVEQWDPAEIFLYQVENSPFTVFHFVAHMLVIRNSQPWERYRRHRQWVLTEQRQHVPTFKQLLVALICSLFKTK